MAKKETELDGKVRAIGQLLQMFKMERMVYLIITMLCVTILITCAIILLVKDLKNNLPVVIGMLAAGGGVSITCGRLLKMWSDALQLLSSNKNEE
jgi:hypothetical protein